MRNLYDNIYIIYRRDVYNVYIHSIIHGRDNIAENSSRISSDVWDDIIITEANFTRLKRKGPSSQRSIVSNMRDTSYTFIYKYTYM